ncbi:MAG: hypothetical protein ABI947_01470 [Chloroflexota bacterium]
MPYLDSRILQWVDKVKPWHSRFAVLDLSILFFGSLAALWVGLVFLVALYYLWMLAQGIPLSPTTSKTVDNNFGFFFAAAILLSITGIAFILSRLRTQIFPITTFAIGHGLKQHNRAVVVQRLVGGLVAAIAAVAYGLIANWLSRGWK